MPARSLPLDFGPSEHFRILHGSHRLPVYVAVQQATWMEQRVDHEVADFVMGTLANTGTDAYVTANAYKPFTGHRSVENVALLNAVYVDLDCHRIPHLAGLSPQSVLDRLAEAFPSLPTPTFVMSSGRGMWLWWRFKHSLSPARYLPRWQRLERELVALLKPFGADPAATDAARVSRIVGSVNTRNGERVGMAHVGELVTLAELESAVRSLRPVLRPVPTTGVPGARAPRPRTPGKGRGLRPYVLHRDRLADLRTLVRLRGGRLADGRRRMLYVAACSFAWYCPSIEAMERELVAFASETFSDPQRYGPPAVGSVMQRMAADLPLAGYLHAEPRRYRLRSKTIVGMLEITAAEQRELRTLIGRDEKNRRRSERRRALGMAPREAIAARTAQRVAEARRMKDEGMTQAKIAAALSVSQQAVAKLLKRV